MRLPAEALRPSLTGDNCFASWNKKLIVSGQKRLETSVCLQLADRIAGLRKSEAKDSRICVERMKVTD